MWISGLAASKRVIISLLAATKAGLLCVHQVTFSLPSMGCETTPACSVAWSATAVASPPAAAGAAVASPVAGAAVGWFEAGAGAPPHAASSTELINTNTSICRFMVHLLDVYDWSMNSRLHLHDCRLQIRPEGTRLQIKP